MTTAIALSALPLADAWDGHHDGGWWMVMGVVMVLFWALVIAGIVWLVREVAGGGRAARDQPPREAGDAGEAPLAILDRRLAAGEIDVDEYRERRAALGAGGG